MSHVKRLVEKANGKVIGETTPIQIGLAMGILLLLLGCVWWAASVNSKLDFLVSRFNGMEGLQATMKIDLDNLKLWRAEVDRSGTKSLDELKKEVQSMKMELEIHTRIKP